MDDKEMEEFWGEIISATFILAMVFFVVSYLAWSTDHGQYIEGTESTYWEHLSAMWLLLKEMVR